MSSEKLTRLRETYAKLLQDQNAVNAKLQKLYALQIDYNKKTRKNVDACVAVSKRAGFIEYYAQPKDDIPRCEAFIEQIGRFERDMKEVQSQIKTESRRIADEQKSSNKQHANSMREWFAKNGRPEGKITGLTHTFEPSKRYLPHYNVTDEGVVEEVEESKGLYHQVRSQKKSVGVKMVKPRRYG